jgi:transposase
MLTNNLYLQHDDETVYLNELIPLGHWVRRVDMAIDFEFIRSEAGHWYDEKSGWAVLDPIQLFKILFLGYLFNINSERELISEVRSNMAYRWFLGIGLSEDVIHHSTLSHNRMQYFRSDRGYLTIFDRLVRQAVSQGLMGSKGLKGHNNKKICCELDDLTVKPSAYLETLDKAVRKSQTLSPMSRHA